MAETPEQAPSAPVPLDDTPVDDVEELILCSRYGELEELRELVARLGAALLASARDDRGNSCLHMAAANGHSGARSALRPGLMRQTSWPTCLNLCRTRRSSWSTRPRTRRFTGPR